MNMFNRKVMYWNFAGAAPAAKPDLLQAEAHLAQNALEPSLPPGAPPSHPQQNNEVPPFQANFEELNRNQVNLYLCPTSFHIKYVVYLACAFKRLFSK